MIDVLVVDCRTVVGELLLRLPCDRVAQEVEDALRVAGASTSCRRRASVPLTAKQEGVFATVVSADGGVLSRQEILRAVCRTSRGTNMPST